MAKRIVLLPGDGIGPEIMAAARELLDAVGEFELDERLLGGASIDAHGTALTDEVLDACRSADAVLLAAVGGPKWDTTDPDAPRPEQGLLGLRKELGLFANLRPVQAEPRAARLEPAQARAHRGHRPARGPRAHRRDLLRRPRPRRRHRARHLRLHEGEVERIARVAFRLARRKVTSVDKANILETSRLWRKTVERVAEGQEHPAGAHARGQRRHAARIATRRVRRPADREPVRRHPQRRGRDAHRLARDAAERVAGRIRPGAVRAGARLGARHRRHAAGRIRSRCSAPWR